MKKQFFRLNSFAVTLILLGVIIGCGHDDTGKKTATVIPGQLIVQFASPVDVDRSDGSSSAVDSILTEELGDNALIKSARKLVPDGSAKKISERTKRDMARLVNKAADSELIKRQVMKKENMLNGLVLITIEGIDSEETVDLAEKLRKNPVIKYAMPDLKIQVDLDNKENCAANSEPCDDPSYTQTWSMEKTNRAQAWNITQGSRRAVVAVLDTGVDYTHADLANNIWINSDEIPENSIDDDNNGYIDDIRGYDFATGDADPMDAFYHGTHVAGIVAANGTIKGVAPNTRILPIRIINDVHSVEWSQMVESFSYAIANGADIINCSFTYSIPTDIPERMQEYYDLKPIIADSDLLVVFSAGNTRTDINEPVFSDSINFVKDNDDHLFVVAWTDPNDDLAVTGPGQGSNWGVEDVDLGAPGQCVYSTIPGNGYDVLSGTSMAAPHVAGVAALIKSKYPKLHYFQIKKSIMDGVDPVAALSGKVVTGGRLNAYQSLVQAAAMPASSITFTLPADGSSENWYLVGAKAPKKSFDFQVNSNYPIVSVVNATLVSGNTYRITIDPNIKGEHTTVVTTVNEMHDIKKFTLTYNSAITGVLPVGIWYIYRLSVSWDFNDVVNVEPVVYRVVCSADLETGYDIFSIYSDDPYATKLTDVVYTASPHPAVSPDGSKIAFVSNVGMESDTELFVMKSDGSDIQQLTNNDVSEYNPAWSPDGTKIAYQSDECIFVINSDGTNQVQLTSANEAYTPDWSPDGTTLAVDYIDEIYKLAVNGSSSIQLTSNYEHEDQPQWSPDGTKILFLSIRDGNWEIYVMNADGSGQTNLTQDSRRNMMPQWSPDGSKIAYITVVSESSRWEVFVMNANGSNKIQLTNTVLTSRNPVWSPDGKRLFYIQGLSTSTRIYMMDPDGTDNKCLTPTSADYDYLNVNFE